MKAEEFDRLFDEGGDIDDYIDWASARRPNLELQPVAVDLPVWIIRRLDRQAKTAGVTRDAVIRLWLAERLDREVKPALAAE